jgi:hypothetical protein
MKEPDHLLILFFRVWLPSRELNPEFEFLGHCQSNELEVNPTSVQSFLVELREKYIASTLWTIFTILKAYFVNQHQLDLKTLVQSFRLQRLSRELMPCIFHEAPREERRKTEIS